MIPSTEAEYQIKQEKVLCRKPHNIPTGFVEAEKNEDSVRSFFILFN